MYTAMNPTPLRGIAISMLAATLVACLSLPPYTVTFPALRGELDPLPVELLDETGLAVGLEIGELDGFPGDLPDVRAVPDVPNTIAVDWMGGMCDEGTKLTLVALGARLQLTIETERGGGCRLAGIPRTVHIPFSRPIDAKLIDVAEK